MKLWIVIATLVVALSAPALGELDMINGSDEDTSSTLSFYAQDPDGDQNWVREYDGRRFGNVFGIEDFFTLGYNGPYQYTFGLRDLTVGNQDVGTDVTFKNQLGLSIVTTGLTHRLPVIPEIDPFLAGTAAAGTPATPSQIGTRAAGGNEFLNLDPNNSYRIDRRVTDYALRTMPKSGWGPRLVLGIWEEKEQGDAQLLFRSRQAQPGVIAGSQRGSASVPINRFTHEDRLGFDWPIANTAVVNYRYYNTKFQEYAGRPTDPREDFAPLNSLTRIGTKMHNNVIKARAKITDRLHFTGSQINKSRSNFLATLSSPTRIDINATNAALTYMATDTLTVTGRYRRMDLDNGVGVVLDDDGLPTNQALSRDVRRLDLDASYTGLARTYLSGGFSHSDITRSVNALHATHEEFEHPFTSPSTKAATWRAALRMYPTSQLSLTGNYLNTNADDSGYGGVPNENTQINANATYMLRDNMAVYGDLSKVNQRNSQIRVNTALIPTPSTDAAGAAIRNAAAGQGYTNEFITSTIGAWYALNSKLTVDVTYGHIEMNSAALWIIGTDPAFPPQLLPDYVPFKGNNNQMAYGATYAFRPKWRAFGRFGNSRSSGHDLISAVSVDAAGTQTPLPIGPVWAPFSVVAQFYTLGFAHDISLKDTLSLNVSVSKWTDQIDAAQDGSYSLWRLAWSHGF